MSSYIQITRPKRTPRQRAIAGRLFDFSGLSLSHIQKETWFLLKQLGVRTLPLVFLIGFDVANRFRFLWLG